MAMYRKCSECGRNNVKYTSGHSGAADGAIGSIFGEMKGHICEECKTKKKNKKKEEKKKKKEEKKKKKENNDQPSNSSNSGGSNISGEEVLVAAAALAELFTAAGKKHQAKINELKSLAIPSNPKDLKKSFMFLTSQFPSTLGMAGKGLEQARHNKELADIIINKLESFLKYWTLECTSETDYEKVKNMFEEEIATLIEKCEKQKKKEILGFSIFIIVLIAMYILLISQSS